MTIHISLFLPRMPFRRGCSRLPPLLQNQWIVEGNKALPSVLVSEQARKTVSASLLASDVIADFRCGGLSLLFKGTSCVRIRFPLSRALLRFLHSPWCLGASTTCFTMRFRRRDRRVDFNRVFAISHLRASNRFGVSDRSFNESPRHCQRCICNRAGYRFSRCRFSRRIVRHEPIRCFPCDRRAGGRLR